MNILQNINRYPKRTIILISHIIKHIAFNWIPFLFFVETFIIIMDNYFIIYIWLINDTIIFLSFS